MVPLGLALGINKQTWKNDSYNNLAIKIGQGKKNGAGTCLIPVHSAFVCSALAKNYVRI